VQSVFRRTIRSVGLDAFMGQTFNAGAASRALADTSPQ